MNRLPLGRRAAVINALVEGNSIRSTERIVDVHRDTICRLLVEVGEGCAKIMDQRMRGLPCRRVEVDEVWTFCQKKEQHLERGDDRSRVGDQWVFVALDPESKLIPSYRIGKRRRADAIAFIGDLSHRLANRVQISSDGLNTYIDAVEEAFGIDVDYGQIVKFYEAEPIGPGRYAPPKVIDQKKIVIVGRPDQATLSTSLVERQNLSMRTSMRRFTRLSLGFSKKIENLRAAVHLHFAHYNFVRLHRSLRMTPAMAIGLENRLWSIEELVERTSN